MLQSLNVTGGRFPSLETGSTAGQEIKMQAGNATGVKRMRYNPVVKDEKKNGYSAKRRIFNRISVDDEDKCPADGRFLLYRASFAWISSLIKLGFEQPLQPNDLNELPDNMLSDGFMAAWKGTKQKSKFRLAKSLIRAFFTRYHLPMFTMKLLLLIMTFVKPLLLHLLLESIAYSSTQSHVMYQPYLYAAVLAFMAMTQAILQHWYFWQGVQCALTVRGTLIAAIQRKILLLHVSTSAAYGGMVSNFSSVDADTIMSFCWNSIHEMWASPAMVLIGLILLMVLIGPSALVGCGIMVLSVAFSAGYVTTVTTKIHKEMMKISDKRIQYTSEFIQNIKLLKLYSYVTYFSERILGERNRQEDLLKRMAFWSTITRLMGTLTPMMVSLMTFLVYCVILGNPLDPIKVFTALLLFNTMKEPLSKLPEATSLFVRTRISLERIQKFLEEDESTGLLFDHGVKASKTNVIDSDTEDEIERPCFHLRNISVGWLYGGNDVCIQNVNVMIPKGKLTMIVGGVGSGKTTLIHALIGEAQIRSGDIDRYSTDIAYASQQPWIMNDTIRNNILFGEDMNQRDYLDTIKASALVRDLARFPNGDSTVVGDQNEGVQLSGGQRQRLALARAVYSKKQVYIFDEPLSAVDSIVAQWLFNEVIGQQGCLKNKTRVVVTHRVQFAPKADFIIVMDEGKIIGAGTYMDLKIRGIDLTKHVHNLKVDDDAKREDEVKELIAAAEKFGELQHEVEHDVHLCGDISGEVNTLAKKSLEDVSIEDKEERNSRKSLTPKADDDQLKCRGATSKQVYFKYFFSAAGPLTWLMIAFTVAASQALIVGSEMSLASWSQNLSGSSENAVYLNRSSAAVYGTLVCFAGLLFWLRCYWIANATCKASFRLHEALFYGIQSTFASFFDTHAIGRILGRFTRDTDILDHDLPGVVMDVFSCSVASLATVVLVMIITPVAIPLLVPIMYMYYRIQTYYLPASRELKRLESSSRAPIYSFISQTSTGRITIRAYGSLRSKRFVSQVDRAICNLLDKIDHNVKFYFYSFAVNRWLGVRLELVGALMVMTSSLLAISWRDISTKILAISNKSIDVSWIALGITTTLAISGYLNWMVRQLSDLEVQMNAVERVCEFSSLPTEEKQDILMWQMNRQVSGTMEIARRRLLHFVNVPTEWSQVFAQMKFLSYPNLRRTFFPSVPGNQYSAFPLDEEAEYMVKEMEEIQPIFMPPDNWPKKGDVQANHLTVRYRPDLPPVLSDVTFNIASGEKIGIVGHTGSGKSTLSLAFFRLVELSSENGSHFAPPLIIDGIDIRNVPLDRLRRSIGIIPQEPVLFSGSLRFNLDPSLKATEAQMWEVLKQAGLETWARSKGGLDIQFDPANTTSSADSLDDSGTHMSMGQRQLLCLARQLLIRPKILVMDEATASLDYEADAKIKQVIRQNFHETTIFTIAHRLETILDGDRVMVIDTGKLVEIGTPKSLLQNKKSYFYSLVEHEKQNMK